MSRTIFSLISLLFFHNILAANTVTLTWIIPTQRTDNSALPVSEIASYEVQQASGTCASNPTFTAIATVKPGSVSTYILQNVTVGTKCWRILAEDVNGLRSDPSNTAELKVLAPPKAGVLSVVIKVEK